MKKKIVLITHAYLESRCVHVEKAKNHLIIYSSDAIKKFASTGSYCL